MDTCNTDEAGTNAKSKPQIIFSYELPAPLTDENLSGVDRLVISVIPSGRDLSQGSLLLVNRRTLAYHTIFRSGPTRNLSGVDGLVASVTWSASDLLQEVTHSGDPLARRRVHPHIGTTKCTIISAIHQLL
jgi:hypothetical protein